MDERKNGILIPNKEYRAMDGVSSSDLKKMAKSPAHFRYWKDNPKEDTPSLLFGRAVHKYILEKDDFYKEFAVEPDINRRTKDGKAQWLLFQDQNEGKDIVSLDDFQQIKDMHYVLYSNSFARTLLTGKKELSYFTEDSETGITMKCRPDCLTEVAGTHFLIDYKTCNDASTDVFMRDSIKFMYDMQMAYYKHILDEILGVEHTVVFIAQEKTAPYCVNIMEPNEYYMRSGADMFREYLNLYKECSETGNWYGYMKDEVNSLGLPNWLQKQYESLGSEVE